jgi:hypothetical protein
MIDSPTFDAFAQIERRAADVRYAYESGFEPSNSDVALEHSAQSGTRSANPLAAVAPDGAYFVVGASDRPRAYTRDGELRFAGGGLEQRDGTPVLGFATNRPRAALEPLRADPIDVALGRVRNVQVDADGAVAYTRATVDPRSGATRFERVSIGRLALARFPAGTRPLRLDATRLGPPAGVIPHIGLPEDGNFAALRTHARDRGRLDLAAGLDRLSEAYLSFDALRAAHRASGEGERTAMDLLK